MVDDTLVGQSTCWTLYSKHHTVSLTLNTVELQVPGIVHYQVPGTLVPDTILRMIVAEYRTECRMYPSEQFMKQHISVLLQPRLFDIS